MEIELPNSKHVLICSAYRPPSSENYWIDLFDEELSITQSTGLELILMGDFNIDLNLCTNNKWIHLITLQLFDLSQIVTEPTRVTETVATIIDLIYVSNPENISNCYVYKLSISDHFPVCLSRKVNRKLIKNMHTLNSFRNYKHFDETKFLADLASDLDTFETSHTNTVDVWSATIYKHKDKLAPIKTKRIKAKGLLEWFTPEISLNQRLRDNCQRLKQWEDYRQYRNKVRHLIRTVKRRYFSGSITKSKDTKRIWVHLRAVNGDAKTLGKTLPDEITIYNQRITKSKDIAHKLNIYFTSVADILNNDKTDVPDIDTKSIANYVNSKVPTQKLFTIPHITNLLK